MAEDIHPGLGITLWADFAHFPLKGTPQAADTLLSMGTSKLNLRRFRINPVELAIFTGVTLIFVNSVYNLLYERPAGGFAPMLTRGKAPGETGLSGRFPASIERRKTEAKPVSLLARAEISCQDGQSHKTSAAKLQLGGALCGSQTSEDTQKLLKTEIVNTANHYAATVFPDNKGVRFTTDYIPLVDGVNSIKLDFVYKGGRTVSQTLAIARDPAASSDSFKVVPAVETPAVKPAASDDE